jgi:hypothetical protein
MVKKMEKENYILLMDHNMKEISWWMKYKDTEFTVYLLLNLLFENLLKIQLISN